MMRTSASKSSVKLESHRDWHKWFKAVRKLAQDRHVFELIDPDLAEMPVQPIRPNRPEYSDVQPDCQSYLDLTEAQKRQYRALLNKYRGQTRQFEKRHRALVAISNFIDATVSRDLRPFYYDLDTPYDILNDLKKRVAPSTQLRELELTQDYNALQQTPKPQTHRKMADTMGNYICRGEGGRNISGPQPQTFARLYTSHQTPGFCIRHRLPNPLLSQA
jgi:hypothetical protein